MTTLSEDRQVGVGIIGAGFARTTQIPAFRACGGARVAAIASARRENAESVAREFGIPFVGDTWRDVVGREDVDLVCVTTPPSTHAEITLAALDAGKAVLCEKPTAMNADEAALMRRRADETGLVAHVDHELRFLPARMHLFDVVSRGGLGQIWHAKVTFRADSRADAARPWNWWSDAAEGGGVLGALGSHAIDSLHFLLRTRTREVFCTLATHVRERADRDGQKRAVTSDDEANLLLNFYDSTWCEGATGSISVSVVEGGRPEHTVEVFGSEGAMRTDETGKLFHAKLGERVWSEADIGEWPLPLPEGMADNEWSRGFAAFTPALVEEVRKGERRGQVRGAATFEDGYHVQRVLDAARASHESGCRVAVGD